jgi:hypothetical protein
VGRSYDIHDSLTTQKSLLVPLLLIVFCPRSYSAKYLFIYFIVVLSGGYIVAFTKVPTIYQIYHTWIHPLHHSLSLPPSIPGIVSTCVIFPFTHMCTQNLYHIYPSTYFPHLLPLPLRPTFSTCPKQDLFCPPDLQFCERKKERKKQTKKEQKNKPNSFVCLR